MSNRTSWMNRYCWRRRVRYESLEQRQMMAVNISASDNNLLITTDSSSNQFGLIQDGIGRLFIYGNGSTAISGDGTVAGQVANTHAGGGRQIDPGEYKNIFIICGSGDDIIEFAGLTSGQTNNLYIDTGDGAADQIIFNTSTFIANNTVFGANSIAETVTAISGDGFDTHHFDHISAKNLVVNSGNGNDNMLFADIGSVTITDNLYIDTGDVFLPGNGDSDAVQIASSSQTLTVGKSLDIRSGNSNAFFTISSNTTAGSVSIVTTTGDDIVRVGANSAVAATRTFSIDTGDGDDEITVNRLTAGKLSIDSGADNDQINVGTNQAVATTSAFIVFADDGNDTANIVNVTSGGDAKISLGDGTNTLKIKNFSSTKNTSVSGGTGIDTFWSLGGTYGNLTASLGSGANRVYFTNSNIAQNLSLVTGTDGDVTNLIGVIVAGDVSLSLGEGANKLSLTNLATTKNTSVSGGSGIDQISLAGGTYGNLNMALGDGANNLRLSSLNVSQNISFTTGSGIDTVLVQQTTAKMLIANTGSGVDSVRIVTNTVFEQLYANLAEGDDSLRISNSQLSSYSLLDGGTGTNILQFASVTKPKLTAYNFVA